MQDASQCVDVRRTIVKHFFEKLWDGRVGEKLDRYCFHQTVKHWKKKFPQLTDAHFDLDMRSRKNTSKHHPQGFQWQVLQQHAEKIVQFEQQHQLSLK